MKIHLTRLMAFPAVLLLALSFATLTQAQSDEGVVYAVLFHSPQCPHCVYFIENEWPGMEAEFGDQLNMLFINVLEPQYRPLMERLYSYYQIPANQRYVPMMFVGDQVFVGGDQLPSTGAQTIRNGIAQGGIPMAPVEGLSEAFSAASSDIGGAEGGDEAAPSAAAPTLGQRFRRDLVGNSLAVVVLILLAISGGLVLVGLAGKKLLSGSLPRVAALIASALTFGLAVSLLVRAGGDGFALVMSALAAAGSLLTGFLLIRASSLKDAPLWLIPLVAVTGLAVTVYLAGVEMTRSTAVCGVVGDCNTVQQSPYAMLFGALPIGVLGIGGYVFIFAAWVLTQGAGQVARFGQSLLMAFTLFGVVFSLYLTFLEPFVIGATCVWCLTSALSMLLLLWLVAPGSAPQPAPAKRGRSRQRRR